MQMTVGETLGGAQPAPQGGGGLVEMIRRMPGFWLPTLLIVALVGCNQERNESIRYMNKGVAAFEQNNMGAAMDYLDQAVETDPAHAQAVFLRGMIRSEKSTAIDKAEADLRKAIELDSERHRYHYHLGKLLSRKGDFAGAINAFEKAIQKKKSHAESHRMLARALEAEGQYDRAQAAYGESIKTNPRDPVAYNDLGNLYMRFEKFPQAIQVFKNGIENNPEEASNYNDLGRVYDEQKRYAEAIKQYQLALQHAPGLAKTWFNLGMAYAATDDPRRAIEYLKGYLSRRATGDEGYRISSAQEMVRRLEDQLRRGDDNK